jgi:hypothetical protein
MRFLGVEYVTSLVRYRIFEAEICYFLRTTHGGSFTRPELRYSNTVHEVHFALRHVFATSDPHCAYILARRRPDEAESESAAVARALFIIPRTIINSF